jgi:hypothetical protein
MVLAFPPLTMTLAVLITVAAGAVMTLVTAFTGSKPPIEIAAQLPVQTSSVQAIERGATLKVLMSASCMCAG